MRHYSKSAVRGASKSSLHPFAKHRLRHIALNEFVNLLKTIVYYLHVLQYCRFEPRSNPKFYEDFRLRFVAAGLAVGNVEQDVPNLFLKRRANQIACRAPKLKNNMMK